MKSIYKIFISIGLVVILGIIFFLWRSGQIKKTPIMDSSHLGNTTTTELKEPTSPQKQDFCFSKTLDKDITEAKITIEDGKVTGVFNWIPFEKDSARGTLSGTVEANGEMNVLYDYMIEGAHQTEEKIMKIENGALLIKHGELLDPKYNGHLVYKNKNAAVYNETLNPCTE